MDELAAYIRNLTGGLDSRALGVTANQRAAEDMWLAFSPRLLRSTIALAADASRPFTPRGRAAFKSLGTLMGGAAGLYVISGIALGKSEEEIKEGLNPLSGRRFMSHNINGNWIGIGGQVRAITQFMTAMGETVYTREPSRFWSTDQWRNPFLQFYTSRGAPALRIAGSTIEATTGADVMPFDEIDGVQDWAKQMATAATPFYVQGWLDGMPPSLMPLEFVGARVTPNERDKITGQIFQQDFRTLEEYQKWFVNESLGDKRGDFDSIEQERRQKMQSLIAFTQRPDFYLRYLEVKYRYAGMREYASKGIEFADRNPNDSRLHKKLMARYYRLFDDESLRDASGKIDSDAFSRARRNLLSELPRAERAEGRAILDRNTNLRPIPHAIFRALSPDSAERLSIMRSIKARIAHLQQIGKPELVDPMVRRFFMLDQSPTGVPANAR